MKRKVANSKFAKADVNIFQGDKVTFITEGADVESTFEGVTRTNFEISINLKDGEDKVISMNIDSFNNMLDVYGEDTSKWIGEDALVNILDIEVNGKNVKQVILTHPNADPANPIPSEISKNEVEIGEGEELVGEIPY